MRFVIPNFVLAVSVLMVGFVSSAPVLADNLHLIEENPATGFALYRTGQPNRAEVRELCRLGIQEMMVLSGDAAQHEERFKNECPTLKVVYNQTQNPKFPLTTSFIKQFDEWVEQSMQRGIKIAFRCNCGCHRTGRLAAYYQMKYQGFSAQAAIKVMNEKGKFMIFFPGLDDQVYALNDYMNGRACSVRKKYCVQEDL